MFLLLLFWPVSVGVMASKEEVLCQSCMSFVKLRKNSHLTEQQGFGYTQSQQMRSSSTAWHPCRRNFAQPWEQALTLPPRSPTLFQIADLSSVFWSLQLHSFISFQIRGELLYTSSLSTLNHCPILQTGNWDLIFCSCFRYSLTFVEGSEDLP